LKVLCSLILVEIKWFLSANLADDEQNIYLICNGVYININININLV
jgi:hypothetical protein